MSSYVVIKTINGRQYRYRQETWRDGGRMRTRSTYLGPVAAAQSSAVMSTESGKVEHVATGQGTPTPHSPPRRRSAVTEFLKNIVRKRDRGEDIAESEAEMRERVAREDAQRARDERVNELLTADTLALDAIAEISTMQRGGQQEGESRDSPNDAGEGSAKEAE